MSKNKKRSLRNFLLDVTITTVKVEVQKIEGEVWVWTFTIVGPVVETEY